MIKPGRRFASFVMALASPRLMAAFFLLMAAAALGVAYNIVAPTSAALVPFGLLAVNLTASIASNARFRADLPLLVFHLSLLAFVALLAVARLTYFQGAATVPVGAGFAGDFHTEERGPLHGELARALRFSNESFTEVFPEGNKYRATENRVRFRDAAGNLHEGVIGDDRPLVLDGYRIYTSRNRGFAPLVQFTADSGEIQFATLQLGKVGEDGFTAGMPWKIPSGPEIWLTLSTERMQPAAGTKRDNLGAKEARNKLVLRHDERFYDLVAGQSVDLPGGRLTYSRLSAWMGYSIVYDPTKPWVLGTVAVAIVSLIWFYARRLWRTWDED
jgi:hypothetical protein